MDHSSASFPYRTGDTPAVLVDGKRKRRPTNFAGFLTEDKQFDTLISGNRPSETAAAVAAAATAAAAGVTHRDVAGVCGARGVSPAPPGPKGYVGSQQYSAAAPAPNMSARPNIMCSSSGVHIRAPVSSMVHSSVKKIPGVQNATRKALEWLQHGDMTLVELAQHLPKLSKARVEVVMEALRAAGLVSLIRKHAPDDEVSTSICSYRVSGTCTKAVVTGLNVQQLRRTSAPLKST